MHSSKTLLFVLTACVLVHCFLLILGVTLAFVGATAFNQGCGLFMVAGNGVLSKIYLKKLRVCATELRAMIPAH